jgi:hypothetical protein
MTDNTFVFICGLHKSGTSLLFRLLREHPQVSGFRDTGVPRDEGQYLQSVYPPDRAFGGPGRFGFKRAAHFTERSSLVTESNRQTLIKEWGSYWDLSKPVLIEKTPANLIRSRFLQALFPNSKFIVIRRHPVPVALATVKWSGTSLYSLIKHWVTCHQIWERDKEYIKEFLELKYEDLVRDPMNELKRMCEFIGGDGLPELTATPDPSFDDGYFGTWRSLKRERYIRIYIKLIEQRFQKHIKEFGYSFYFKAWGKKR